ncbi:hypothetical protein M378DRAFT_133577 [Amanita muscaria Koide BX008]|uniref:Uncharacterized protein n=1 Tax=Amanita muscaria (strain Koide BX008) TaxID=946122 RepID=A0A0C2WJS1_AMAMK|nr:hypothetical protein M378DRAFT_133577 [Amanita muscaria Koide BX008]
MLYILLLVLQSCLNVVASTDFKGCYDRLRNGEFGLDSAVDSNGNGVTDIAQAAGLTYEACKIDCGPGSEAFIWRNFSNQFTAWLLPWLALISQLPYGANDALSNFETMVLTVGSPMLAGYSLALAVTSNRWMIKRFRRSTHRSSFYAARILCSLQQVSFDIAEKHILPSLIVLKENDVWWRKLDEALDYPSPRWTLAAIVSMGYVALAYAFTWVDTLTGELTAQVFANGQCISSIWLSLLPIVTCNLQLSPKSDADRIRKAVETANNSFFIVTEAGGLEQTTSTRAVIVETASRDMEDEDQICPTSICFYARIFSWIQTARRVTDAFDAVSHHEHTGQQGKSNVNMRTRSEVIQSCKLEDDRSHFYDIFRIYMISTLLAVFLQWGTTGAAIMAIYLTPTRGFGCRSASFLLYGVLSTIVWLLLVISSVLANSFSASRKHGKSRKVIGALVIFFRQAAKTIAAINAAWILTSSLFQFSSIFDNCYCNAAVLGLGSKAYAVLNITPEDQRLTKAYWTAGMTMASGTALVFIAAINLLLKRPEQRSSSE